MVVVVVREGREGGRERGANCPTGLLGVSGRAGADRHSHKHTASE